MISLRNKIAKLQFEIDDLMPSLKFHEQALVELIKAKSEEVLSEEEEPLEVQEDKETIIAEKSE